MTVIPIDTDIAFTNSGKKIRLPVTKLPLCNAVGDVSISKKQRDWVALNAVILTLFLTESAILDGEMASENVFKIFSKIISKKGTE